MVVCHCEAVNDGRIRAEVRSGAQSVVEVMLRCRAGTTCGGCRPTIADVVADERLRCELLDATQVA